jgi:hypothetical protein
MTTPVFASVYAQFLDDLKETFPEFRAALLHAGSVPSESAEARFVEVWRTHTSAVAAQDSSLFAGAGVELVPGFVMTAALWSELSAGTHAAIWKYLSTLLLLAANDGSEGLWDLSGFQTTMAEIVERLKGGAEGSEEGLGGLGDVFAQFQKMAESFGFKDLSGASNSAAAGAAAGGFKIPERLFKGHIAKIVEELVKEFKPEDFGITPEMMEVKDPKVMFEYLQEIFTKKPETLMAAGQKIAKKLQAKFASGSIKREDIVREVEELMKEFSGNEAFAELFGGLGDMLKSTDRESGNEHSARRREVQERLRRKAAEKEARRAAGTAGTAGGAATNVVVNSEAEARAAAAAAALLLEDEADKKKAGAKPKRR